MDSIFVFDPETGQAIRWNSVFNEVTGYNDEEISSMKAPVSYYSEEDLERASKAIERILKGLTSTVELSLITKDGHKIHMNIEQLHLKILMEINLSFLSVGILLKERKRKKK